MKTMRTRTKRTPPTNRRSCASRTKISPSCCGPPHDYLIAAYSPDNLSSVIQKECCKRYRHLADISRLPNVRFAPEAALGRLEVTPESRLNSEIAACPKSAQNQTSRCELVHIPDRLSCVSLLFACKL